MSIGAIAEQVRRQGAQRWWVPLVRGIILVILGLVVLCWPAASWVAFYWVAAAFFIADGLVAVIGGIVGKGVPDRVWAIVFGVLAIALGIAALVWPGITLTVLFVMIAVWAVVGGIFSIATAVAVRKLPGSGWGWTLTLGILSILMGIMLIVWPITGALTLALVVTSFVGVFAILAGVMLIVFGAKLHSLKKTSSLP